MREYDWASSPLGPPERWTPRLRTCIELMLASKQPMHLGWTHDMITFYNDAYRPILGADKHPGALGRRTADIFEHDGYPGLKPYFDALFERGESFAFTDILVPLVRYGYLEECYFDVSYTPISGDVQVEGMLSTVNETTERVLSIRRTETLALLASGLLGSSDLTHIAAVITQVAQRNQHDLPFVLLYLPSGTQDFELRAATGLDEVTLGTLEVLPETWAVRGAIRVEATAPRLTSPWPEPVTQVALLPLVQEDTGSSSHGVLVIGLNPRKRYDRAYREFLSLLRSQVMGALRTAELSGVLHEQNAQLDVRNQTLEAFAQLSRDLVGETDRVALVRRAQEIVLSLLPHGYGAYYELEEGRWRAKCQVGTIGNEALQAMVDAGFPADVPSLAIPMKTAEPYYQDVYLHGTDTPVEVVQHIQAVATLPLRVQGVTVGMFVIALFHQRTWTDVDRALLETTLHSLGLALERAEFTRQLTSQRDTLDAQTHALGDANEALEAFAYSVSHDLRTPVRHIAGFASLLRKALAAPLDLKAERYLAVIEQSAQRMDSLIDAMLDLSRSSRRPLHIRPLDLGALLTDVRAEMMPDLLDRDISWEVGPLPVVWADRDLLRQVWLNLLSNAVKYTRKQDRAVIEVRAEERPDTWVLMVRDNGVGFDARHADKLFGVFQRLHLQADFEGTGVGLANVRRILARHGGQVWAESELGKGATFLFSLPKAAVAQPGQ